MTKIVMALLMVGAMALVACGSDDDDSSGKKGLKGNGVCDIDPQSTECQECSMAGLGCLLSNCATEFGAVTSCSMSCTDEADCCPTEQAAVTKCVENKCPDLAACGGN